MAGEPIKQVQDGMRTLVQTLRTDPYALETVYISIIAFAGKARILSPLTEIFKFIRLNFLWAAARRSAKDSIALWTTSKSR